ncbi:DUF2845 domain-containing protein [Steroidobacter sp.]|uniref:DUF2845 domain-containing protein n=1 Tax=Steroidobacter sp. TaxID=1978227 RepID=UPI001A3DAE55|nr:DUF2845 domain-containing protein [Steroidobacter sp.]MBL8271756.1 DUF2845 domain-containing protein [Steroidobacter sp.]
MTKTNYLVFCVGLMALAAVNVAGADSMRCGKWVVSEATPVDELLTKCGEPRSRDVSKDDVWATNVNGMRVKTGAVTTTERWIFQASSSALPMQVVIVDGKIVSLTRVDK